MRVSPLTGIRCWRRYVPHGAKNRPRFRSRNSAQRKTGHPAPTTARLPLRARRNGSFGTLWRADRNRELPTTPATKVPIAGCELSQLSLQRR